MGGILLIIIAGIMPLEFGLIAIPNLRASSASGHGLVEPQVGMETLPPRFFGVVLGDAQSQQQTIQFGVIQTSAPPAAPTHLVRYVANSIVQTGAVIP